jgi:TPR repeat protein
MPDPVPVPVPQQQQQQQQQPPGQQQRDAVNCSRFSKFILVGALAGLVLFLQITVWTMELHLEELQLEELQLKEQALILQQAQQQQQQQQGQAGGWRTMANDASGEYDDAEGVTAGVTFDMAEEDYGVTGGLSQKEALAIIKAEQEALALVKAEQDKRTVRYSSPLDRKELHLERMRTHSVDTGSSVVTAATAYWNQAVSLLLRDWDAMIPLTDDELASSASSTSSLLMYVSEPALALKANATTVGLTALQRAAELGNPDAQYMVANALAMGFWPMVSQQPVVAALNVTDHSYDHDKLSNAAALPHLQVHDTWNPTDRQQQQQLAQAYLYWRMAAISGHVEAAMTLAHRLDPAYAAAGSNGGSGSGNGGSGGSSASGTPKSTKTGLFAAAANAASHKQASDKCWARVFYYRAAADGIVDELESDPNSRAKVVPPMDKHLLHHVHLHGGTGSKLDYFNKPDESPEALQYYHVKATAGMGGEGPSQDAAFTLAKLYHYGLRGVQQNLTLAVEYYEMAAVQGDWEAAGKAGELYLWGMGVPQDAYAAHRMFRIGMPFGLDGCQKKYRQKLKQSKNDQVNIFTCDDASLNGMGLLRLLGLPMILSVDPDEAEDLFMLARDQGNKDAAYNLAMMKLGWETHFRRVSAVPDGGQSSASDEFGSMNYPNRGEYQSILTDLTTAATKGHLQARQRLAMMYTEGVKIPAKPGLAQIVKDGLVQVVPRDCEKALKHYKGIVDNASPQKSRRLRKAYKQYIAGDTASSLRNYLAAAEGGSELAQTNAAFLMERGECLGLSRIDCAKASVRLWKAAALKGSAEASLRVGDFYYYGRFREDSKPVGPFGWAQYFLYPEESLPKLWQAFRKMTDTDVLESAEEMVSSDELEQKLEEDLKMSAHYYRLAAEKSSSPRANYNLGFLYEWGIGLKQDFPLAKRHYDLAVSGHSSEADCPIMVAKAVMNIHEFVVKILRSTSWLPGTNATTSRSSESNEPAPAMAETHKAGHPVPPSSSRVSGKSKTKMSVILSHVLSWESLLILALTIVLWLLLNNRRTARR